MNFEHHRSDFKILYLLQHHTNSYPWFPVSKPVEKLTNNSFLFPSPSEIYKEAIRFGVLVSVIGESWPGTCILTLPRR